MTSFFLRGGCRGVALLSLFLMACTMSPSGRPAAEKPFVVALESAPTQLDPRLATDAYSERIDHLIFSSLIRIGSDDTLLPDLAQRWEVTNNRQYTFHLKKGVLFHDKMPLTSEDVRYTYESILDPTLASPHKKEYEIIERIETPTPTLVRFILKENHAPFLATLTRGIVPKHVAQKDPQGFATRLIGSGPFAFVSYEAGHAVELRANPHDLEGPPSLSRLVFRVIPDDFTRLLEMEKGTIDLLQNAFPPDALPRLQNNKRLKIKRGPSTTYSYMGFNLSDPVVGQWAVRKAIAHAMDRDKIAKYIFQGLASPTNSLLTPHHWAYAATKGYPYDPKQAAALLEHAQGRNATGRLHLTYKTSQNELSRRVAEVIQDALSQIGIDVTIRSFEWGTFYSDIQSGNFQIFTLSWVGATDPDIYYNLFHAQSVPPAGANRGRYQNRRMDSLLEKGRMLLHTDQRKVVYKEVQEILAETLPYISLWHAENTAVMKKEVEGYRLYANGDFYSLRDVSIVPTPPEGAAEPLTEENRPD